MMWWSNWSVMPCPSVIPLALLLLTASVNDRTAGVRVAMAAGTGGKSDNVRPRFEYHSYSSLTDYLLLVAKTYPNLTDLYTIGQSVQGRQLWVIALSSSPTQHRLLQPEMKYVANMHGNEAITRELMLHLTYYLLKRYGSDPLVTKLLDTSRIHIMPSMNPDGYENATSKGMEGECEGVWGRYNTMGFDLNRNFPGYFEEVTSPIQPETRAVMDWLKQHQFVLSANIHGGAMVANYPYDNYHGLDDRDADYKDALYSTSPDDDILRYLARVYADRHHRMRMGRPCPGADRTRFPGGITNGAAWYPVAGSMQDYNYIVHGCFEITLEISCCKFAAATELHEYWQDNRDSLLSLLQQGHIGVKGLISDKNRKPIPDAVLQIVGRKHTVNTTSYGEYWRLLLPGDYILKVEAPGYPVHLEPFSLDADQPLLVLNVTLTNSSDQTENTAPCASVSSATAPHKHLTSSGALLCLVFIVVGLLQTPHCS